MTKEIYYTKESVINAIEHGKKVYHGSTRYEVIKPKYSNSYMVWSPTDNFSGGYIDSYFDTSGNYKYLNSSYLSEIGYFFSINI